MPTYTVFGATGQQGGATIAALLESGASVRAVVRDRDKARSLAEAGADLVVADLTDSDSVYRALDGADRVFAVTTMTDDRGTDGETADGKLIADAARAGGVQHVVYSSVGGAERNSGVPHFESKRRVEEYLAEIGVPHTVIRPTFFFENLLSASVEDGEVVVRLPLPDDVPLQMVAVRDIGKVAAAVLLDPSRVPGGAVEFSGDERTGSQIAAAFGDHAERQARYEALPVVSLDDDMRAMFTWFTRLPAYQADVALTRELDPDVWDLRGWLASGAWSG
ncbi:NmrA/HSCARG family protein [uncultured Jatrophihabitans sp.]|uniref:NmrA/HSCARG family protein n=1 Tax=uncultured Jatrophihabitans sp. TaxID=1610747 RepID=UPI0035CB12E4